MSLPSAEAAPPQSPSVSDGSLVSIFITPNTPSRLPDQRISRAADPNVAATQFVSAFQRLDAKLRAVMDLTNDDNLLLVLTQETTPERLQGMGSATAMLAEGWNALSGSARARIVSSGGLIDDIETYVALVRCLE